MAELTLRPVWTTYREHDVRLYMSCVTNWLVGHGNRQEMQPNATDQFSWCVSHVRNVCVQAFLCEV